MGDVDKAEALLSGKRLIDHVVERLQRQGAETFFISGEKSYGLPYLNIPDKEKMFAGPIAGIYATHKYLENNAPEQGYFLTAPVDAPLLPLDLIDRLSTAVVPAIANTESGLQPAFGLWSISILKPIFDALPKSAGIP
ncbi:MAG: NTP transferase domain-containing protein, partial [Pseudomonadota bacterium]